MSWETLGRLVLLAIMSALLAWVGHSYADDTFYRVAPHKKFIARCPACIFLLPCGGPGVVSPSPPKPEPKPKPKPKPEEETDTRPEITSPDSGKGQTDVKVTLVVRPAGSSR